MPPQYQHQPLYDFRHGVDAARGYKVGVTKYGKQGTKRKLEEYAEQVRHGGSAWLVWGAVWGALCGVRLPGAWAGAAMQRAAAAWGQDIGSHGGCSCRRRAGGALAHHPPPLTLPRTPPHPRCVRAGGAGAG